MAELSYTLESDLSSPALSARKTELARLGDDNAIVLRSKRLRTGASHAVWVIPDKGHSVGQIESSIMTKRGTQHTVRHRSDLAKDAPSGVWFPRKCVYEELEDGAVTKRETVQVQSVDINRPIDKTVFSLVGMGIPNGAPVVTPEGVRDKSPSVWWGGKITPRKDAPLPPAPQTPRTGPEPVDPSALTGGFRGWYVATTVLFSVLAVVFIRRGLSRRPA